VTTGPVDATVTALAGRLPGPRRWRSDVLAEIRDGLLDAAEAYTADGLTPADAERRAVADFGPVEAVAAALREHVAVRRGRRTAALACLPALLGPVWDVGWDLASGAAMRPAASVLTLETLLDWVAVLAAVAGVALWWRLRRPVAARGAAAAAGAFGAVLAVTVCVLAATMLAGNGAWPGGPVGAALVTASALELAALVTSSARTVALALRA